VPSGSGLFWLSAQAPGVTSTNMFGARGRNHSGESADSRNSLDSGAGQVPTGSCRSNGKRQDWLGKITAGGAMQKAAGQAKARQAEAASKMDDEKECGRIDPKKYETGSNSSTNSPHSVLLGFVGSWMQ